jgi:thiamine-monophosphate kinase
MSREAAFIQSLRSMATDAAARGLLDDAAVLEVGGAKLVITHDMIVEGVHFLPSDPPDDIAWKLVAVNLSDLAAKGARPVGAILGYCLGDKSWDRVFTEGLKSVLNAFAIPLLGGDTVSVPHGAPRSFSLTALGEAGPSVPSRAGAQIGDHLWVSGTIGDAGFGLRILRGEAEGAPSLVERYRLPRPRLEAGQALAPMVSAMMDISDGLLIDASRLADASGLSVEVELNSVPLSEALRAASGESRETRLAAATAGDDYELLFAAALGRGAEIAALSERLGLALTRIGTLAPGSGIRVRDERGEMPLPSSLGYEHRS